MTAIVWQDWNNLEKVRIASMGNGIWVPYIAYDKWHEYRTIIYKNNYMWDIITYFNWQHMYMTWCSHWCSPLVNCHPPMLPTTILIWQATICIWIISKCNESYFRWLQRKINKIDMSVCFSVLGFVCKCYSHVILFERNKLLWPRDAIHRHGTGPTLTQAMVCCVMAPSHYLNQCCTS